MSTWALRHSKNFRSSGKGIAPREVRRHLGGLQALPDDLIRMISDLLPPSSKVAFSVSCHSLALILGNLTWKFTDGDSFGDFIPEKSLEYEKIVFLRQLDRDLPHHTMCSASCTKLHKVASGGASFSQYSLHTGFQMAPSIPPIRQDSRTGLLGSKYYFWRLRMAMKRLRHGLDIRDDLKYLSGPSGVDNFVTARIVSNTIHLRIQRWVFTPAEQRLFFVENGLPIWTKYLQMIGFPCAHSGMALETTYPGPLPSSLQHHIGISYPHRFDDFATEEMYPTKERIGWLKCHFCKTATDVNQYSFKNRRLAFVSTSYLDLGDTAMPWDDSWATRCNGIFGVPKIDFDAEEFRSAFEGNEVFDFRAVTTAHEKRKMLWNAGNRWDAVMDIVTKRTYGETVQQSLQDTEHKISSQLIVEESLKETETDSPEGFEEY